MNAQKKSLNQYIKSKTTFRRHVLNLAILAILYPSISPANPTGAQVISGQVSIDNSVAGITTVTNSPNAIINWQDFNIAQNEITRFIQQNGQSAVLNRIIGGNPSEILGSLFSNGKVFLINSNGIVFGAGSQIDTQGLIASTLNLSDSDFQKGNFHFIAGSKTGDISNEGIIHAGKDGNIVLIAPNIENSGIIQSEGGKIVLAAGQELVLTSMDDPDIRFQVQAPKNQVLNVGQLLTEGGAINVFAGSIKHSGDISADSIEIDKQGNVRLVAKEKVTLEKDSTISANNAKGDGGKVVVLSDNETYVHGEINAKGGEGKTGGFVETSGKKLDTANAKVNASAPKGKAGEWLLDPYDIVIVNQTQSNATLPTPTGTPLATSFTPLTQSTLLTSVIESALNLGSNVTIATTNTNNAATDLGNITVNSSITKASGADATLHLKADNAIIISPDVSISATDVGTGKLHIVLNSNVDNANGGNIQLNAGATLKSNGGNIVMGAGTCDTSGCSTASKGYIDSTTQDVFPEGITLINATLNSVGNTSAGNINLNGEGLSGSGISNAHGISLNETTLTSGAGSITLNGKGGLGYFSETDFAGGDNNNGVFITGSTNHLSAISSTTGAISITGAAATDTANVLGQDNFGISTDSVNFATTGGIITLNGTGAHSDAGLMLESNTQIGNLTTGDISLIATNGATSTTDSLVLANNLSGTIPKIQSASKLTLNTTGNVSFADTSVASLGTAGLGLKNLNFLNSSALNITNISASGTISVATNTGNLTVSGAIATTNNSSSALTLNAGQIETTQTTSNILFSGTPSIAIGSGGRAQLFTGSVAGSTGWGTLIPAGHSRYFSDESIVHYTKPLSDGLYAIYREQPTVTVTANSLSKMYDNTAYSGGNGVVIAGLQNNDTLNGTLIYTGSSQGAKNVNVTGYEIIPSGYTTDLGYAIQFVKGTLEITPSTLTFVSITADNKSRIYGDENPTFTGSLSEGSLKTGDTFASIGLTFSTTANARSNVGTYPIIPAITSTNYQLTGINGTLSITPRSLNITANSQTKIYGDADTLTYSTSGLLSGDTLSGALTRISGEDVGEYAISKGSLAANSNYELATFTGNKLVITPASLQISANAQTKIYGDIDPLLTFNASGFKFSDDAKIIIGTLTRAVGKNVGSYAIEKGSLDAGQNYVTNFSGNQLTITPKTLTITGSAKNKTYDGTTVAEFTLTGDNRISGDNLDITGKAAFNDKNVGTAKPISLTDIKISGVDAINYTVGTLPTTAVADIIAKTLKITAKADSKIYDGTTAANVTYDNDRLSGDSVSVSGSANFNDKNVGVAKPVTFNGLQLTGADANNYLPEYPSDTRADITPKILKVSATAESKVYDGTTTAQVSYNNDRISGDLVDITGVSAFADKNAGTAKTVTLNELRLSGTDAGNYIAEFPTTSTADISPRALKVTGTAKNKVYDGNVNAEFSLVGDDRISGDDLTIHGTAQFADKNVGVAKSVVFKDMKVEGSDAGNYTPEFLTGSVADITARALKITAKAQNKEYDAKTDALVIYGDDRISGDALEINGTAKFENKNAGIAKSIVFNDFKLTGTDANNYTPELPTDTHADITPKTLKVTAKAESKIYDGNTSAKVSYDNDRISGDDVAITGVSTFENKNVGVAKTVALSDLKLSGTDANNYIAEFPVTSTADISPRALKVTGTAKSKVYDGNVNAEFSLAGDDRISGDALTILGTAQFADKNVGTKSVVFKNMKMEGADAGNYTPEFLTDSIADITAKALKITATAQSKIYDGTTSVNVSYDNDRISGDSVEVTGLANFNDKNAGTAKPMVFSELKLLGTDAGNYVPEYPTNTRADISPRTLKVTATAESKTYDGTQTVQVSYNNDRLSGDVVDVTGVPEFENKYVGTSKTVLLHGLTLNGLDANNYIAEFPATATADISPKALRITGAVKNKVYDGTLAAEFDFINDDRISDDDLVVKGVAQFANKNVGKAKSVVFKNMRLEGADAENYAPEFLIDSVADITAKALKITAQAESKTYDGTTAVNVSYADDRIIGDSLEISGTAKFENKNAGVAKQVVFNEMKLAGTDANNYTPEFSTDTRADINQKILNVTPKAKSKIYDGKIKADVSYDNDKITGDDVSVNGVASFEDKKVGTGKVVKLSELALSGTDAINYSASFPSSTTGDISERPLTVNLKAKDKNYDGNTTATFDFLSDDRVSGDLLDLVNGTAKFADANVGTNKTVSFSNFGLAGKDGSNYLLQPIPSSFASIQAVEPVKPPTPNTPTATNTEEVSKEIKEVLKDATPEQVQTIVSNVETGVSNQTTTVLTMVTSTTSSANTMGTTSTPTTSNAKEPESSAKSSDDDKKKKSNDVALSVSTGTNTDKSPALQQCK